MNCIIIEDGQDAADYLEYQLGTTADYMEVSAKITSVKDSVTWLKHHDTDLIFLDIQLSDGLSFEIFDHVQVKAPVIFTTSYDQYAIQAFDHNGISYLLKPVKTDSLKMALDKYRLFYKPHMNAVALNDRILPLQTDYQQRFLIESGTVFKTVPVTDVAYFTIQSGRYLVIVTKDGQQHLYENTLERLEQRLDPARFFRINRQYIISIDAISHMQSHDSRRIKIDILPKSKEEVIVAMTKSTAFKEWLNR